MVGGCVSPQFADYRSYRVIRLGGRSVEAGGGGGYCAPDAYRARQPKITGDWRVIHDSQRHRQKAQDEMNKAVEFLRQEFRSVRTGRATPALVDTLRIDVETYGSSMSLKELASIAVTEQRHNN